MEFYTETQSQCGTKTTTGSKTVRGCTKSIQNGILHWTAISMWN